MDFIAIDFETANEDRGSACEIGFYAISLSEFVWS
jgi:hypothetical protein